MKVRTSLIASIFCLVALVAPTEAKAVIQNLNSQTGQSQTFQNDSNVTISSLNNIHSIIWQNLLPISRGGTGAGSFTNGSIPFIFNGTFSQDNSNLFWDDANNKLGIGTASPATTVDIFGTATVTSLISTTDSTINGLNIGLGGGSVPTNTSVGKDALLNANASSSNNTALGYRALTAAGSSLDSTAIGYYALISSTGSDANTAVGSSAMRENTTGDYNTAVGTNALRVNYTGNSNTALGMDALASNYDGSSNIGIGFRAGVLQADESTPLTDALRSIYIGDYAKGYDNNDDNSIVIGSNAIGAGANTTVIGNSSTTDTYFGSASGNSNIHGKKLYLGSSSTPGCIIMGDSDGSGITYLTVNEGVLSASSTPPSACQ